MNLISLSFLRIDKSYFLFYICRAMHIQQLEKYIDYIPKVYKSDEIIGGVTKKMAEFLGLKEGTPVVSGAIDVMPALSASVFTMKMKLVSCWARPVPMKCLCRRKLVILEKAKPVMKNTL